MQSDCIFINSHLFLYVVDVNSSITFTPFTAKLFFLNKALALLLLPSTPFLIKTPLPFSYFLKYVWVSFSKNIQEKEDRKPRLVLQKAAKQWLQIFLVIYRTLPLSRRWRDRSGGEDHILLPFKVFISR